MRDYSKVSGQFWTGKTGKALRGDFQAQVVAMYLMTSPHANMIGVFHCPIIYIAHETGSPIEGATKGLQTLCEGGFCTYDEDTETVWVYEMAKYQIDDALKVTDKRVAGIQKLYENMPESRIKTGFFEKYGVAFHLKNSKPLASPLQAPPKPEAGTEAETEEEPSLSGKPDAAPHSKTINGHRPDAIAALEFLNLKTGRRYEPVDANLRLIASRLKEGATLQDMKSVIAKKCREWGTDPKMETFLRPKTLFSATNFANYKGELHHGD